MPVTCLVYVNIILVKNKSLDLYVRALKSPLILKFLKNLWSLVETVSFFAFCSGLIKNQIILVILPVCLCYHKEFIFCFLLSVISLAFSFENDPYHTQSVEEKEESMLLSDNDCDYLLTQCRRKLRKNWKLNAEKN